MKAARVPSPSAPYRIDDVPEPEPSPREVLVRVTASGVCHSDVFVKEGVRPGQVFPRTPGHEVVGVVERTGAAVMRFKVGDRVGAGWFGGGCNRCRACLGGDCGLCHDGEVTGMTRDGGHADMFVAREDALGFVPEGIDDASAAPLFCAGVTVFNPLRGAGIRPGGLVAI